MNTMKKIAIFLLAVCLAVPCFSVLTYAANGKVMFTDPTTKVGETLELKGVIEAAASIEDRTVVISYDVNKLKFKNGENISETTPGQLKYELKGTKSGTRVEFLIYFNVLQEGTAIVKADSAEAFTTSNQKVTWTSLGSSKVTINPGTATVEPDDAPEGDAPEAGPTVIVDIDGVSYTFSDTIPDSEIPEGFMATTLEYAGSQHRVVKQENTGVTLAYLLDGNKEGKFFMYVEENATFAPFEQIEISKTTTITVLSYVENVTLPEPYIMTTVPINGVDFPAWQNGEKPSLCILYALNTAGEKSFYQYDSEESTYQRFEVPAEKAEEKVDTSLVGKLNEAMGEHLDMVIIGVGVALILFVLVIIILSVKLYNRNAELDEIYDEYGIGLDEEDEDEDDLVRIKYDDEEEDEDRFVILDEEEVEDDEIVEETEPVEDEVPVDSKTEEVEDDISFEESAEQMSEEDEELKFDMPFADDTKQTAEAVELDLFDDEDEEEEEGFVDDDLDFEISFLDLDD